MSQSRVYNNRILTTLPEEILVNFFADMERVLLPLRFVFYELNKPIEYIYFLEEGLACILTKFASGPAVEIGMIGNEGMVGIAALLGHETSEQQIITQIPGTALRISVARCKEALDQSAATRAVVHRIAGYTLSQFAQTAGCNRHHSIEQRLARWLLMASDRAHSDTMPMTHEFLSTMLGVRRTGVTDTAAGLQRSGLIEYRRGRIRLIDRAGLEATACECYGLDRVRLRQLL
jgi:CRP-like cAMP-binding protein